VDLELELWTELLVAAAAVIAVGLLAWSLTWLSVRIARRHDAGSVIAVNRLCRRPFVTTVVAIAVQTAFQALDRVPSGFTQAAGIAIVISACWLLTRALLVGEEILFWRLRIDVADNRRVRRARTQITLVRRVLGVVVVLIALATVLMSFPQLRTFGASLLASAGVAGIIAGLAAQTTMSNMFAGLQLAFTDAVRIDDVVVVEDEWGWIEEITLTYVVIHVWDERRLVLPTNYFVTNPFQNWTRNHARILGAVVLYLDYATPLTELREYTEKVIKASPLWDQQAWVLQVTDTTETTMVVRVLASAPDGPKAWDLRCDIREALLAWLQEHHPQALPVQRNIGMPRELFGDGLITAAEAGIDLDEFEGTLVRNGAAGRNGTAKLNGASDDRPRDPADTASRRAVPVMPDPKTSHLDLQTPKHDEEVDDDENLDAHGRPGLDGGGPSGGGSPAMGPAGPSGSGPGQASSVAVPGHGSSDGSGPEL